MEAGETFIVWDDDDNPAATITINRWTKPELWTEQERDEPALYAHKVTVDRADGSQGLERSLLVSGPHRGHTRVTNDRTAADNNGHHRPAIYPAQPPDSPSTAGRRDPTAISDREEDAGSSSRRETLGWDGVEAH
jgi:hypothetical protein